MADAPLAELCLAGRATMPHFRQEGKGGCDATVARHEGQDGRKGRVCGAVGHRERHAGGKCSTASTSCLRARGRVRAPVSGNLFLGGVAVIFSDKRRYILSAMWRQSRVCCGQPRPHPL